ncbi:Ubiquitin carboxyl-terminal hydrolase 2-like protein [Cladobotryum mycophilum]|uniref:ubiquitinyl hydrolase 1 n=1 Tax=Cladobotryum mycophilum TaxID=491253 RepID=A0ABR0SUX6_9HYPO
MVMANRYDMQSQDQDSSAYASLPGTAPSDFVPHNMTPMKSNLVPGREIAGCHPSRWIYELINNDFTVCDLFVRARRAKLNSHYGWEHPHRLVINGNQSFSTLSNRLLSSVCLDCHFHFVFKISWEDTHADFVCNHNQSSWPLQDNQFPWHHLVWVGSDSDPNITHDQSKYYPLLARENFVCSAPPCTFQLTQRSHPPTVERRKKEQPNRYEGALNDWANQAPSNLNTYLKNLLESTPETARNISKRNKRFSVLFGPRCFSIFRQLEFKETIEEADGVDEGSFMPVPPMPPGGPSGTTETGTYRAYLEDVRAEIQSLIYKTGQTPERPTFLTQALHNELHCREVQDISANAFVKLDRYKLLGVLPTQPREMIVNAYKRQWELLPNKRRELVDALMAIANDSLDEPLSDYAITQSSVFDSQLQQHGNSDEFGLITQALNFLGLNPPNNYAADAIIHAFRQKLVRDPSDASTARSMLMAIAEASNDDFYQTKLLMEVDAKLSLETAKTILGVDNADDPWQKIVETTKAKLDGTTSKDGKGLYLDALDSIAEHTASALLKQSVMELRHANSINGLSSGSTSDENKVANLELPVGLHNIGNTCYLNSLLQYLFTVKPIRDIVFNYEDLRLDLTDEDIQSRRLGGNKMQMDRGEAVVAQAFAQELATLFKNLRTSDKAATRPSQRLANAVLLSTHTLLTGPKQSSEPPAAPKPPPLPARPSPAPPVQKSEDVDMINVSVHPISDPLETVSNSSTQTLVDHDDARSDRSYEKVDVSTESGGQAAPVTIVMSNSGEVKEIIDLEDPSANPEAPRAITGDPEQADLDVDMVDAEESETVDQKVLNALEHQKRSSGTDQQDVEEVMGSIINRLQAAIRPSSIDEKTGIQLEKIMETFFVTTVNYTKKFDEKEYQHEISFDRSITAFPAAEGPCSLYDALGRNFDQQILEDSKLSRYTAIKTLPPVLHILIQRSQTMNSKNGNPVVIPETLYLDRYMDAPHDSPVFRRRVEDWMTAERISDIKSQLAKVETNPSYISFLENYNEESSQHFGGNGNTQSSAVTAESANLDTPVEENWDFDGPVEDDFLLITPHKSEAIPKPEPVPKLSSLRATHTAIREMMENELQQRQQILEENLSSQKQIPYRLHAVICHRGHLTSGHYWVWIHDFEANIWRWYNDADVKENRDTAEVLQTLSTSGEPYFLCYVRDQDKEEYVSVPGRQIPEQETEKVDATASASEARDVDGDVKVEDVEPIEPAKDEEFAAIDSQDTSAKQ